MDGLLFASNEEAPSMLRLAALDFKQNTDFGQLNSGTGAVICACELCFGIHCFMTCNTRSDPWVRIENRRRKDKAAEPVEACGPWIWILSC